MFSQYLFYYYRFRQCKCGLYHILLHFTYFQSQEGHLFRTEEVCDNNCLIHFIRFSIFSKKYDKNVTWKLWIFSLHRKKYYKKIVYKSTFFVNNKEIFLYIPTIFTLRFKIMNRVINIQSLLVEWMVEFIGYIVVNWIGLAPDFSVAMARLL